MITLKNGCKARNLQEQVAYNTEEITKIKYYLGNEYIELDDTALTHTGTLTSDIKKILDAYEVVYVILKQDDDVYYVFRTDYYEDKLRIGSVLVANKLHKLTLDYDNSVWTYIETSPSTDIEYVEIASASSGTLTDAELTVLQASKDNYILMSNEKYYLMDNKTTDGYLAYTHIEKESSKWKIKTITVTISTKAWVKVEQYLEHTEETVLWTNEDTIDSNYEFKPDGTGTGQNPLYASPLSLTGLPTGKTIDDYDYIVIYAIGNNAYQSQLQSEEVKILGTGKEYYISEIRISTNIGVTYLGGRYMVLKSNVLVYNNYNVRDLTTGTVTVDNMKMIPYKILGYKYTA